VLLLGAGGLLLVIGLVLNAIRALIVRAALPPERYRGPAIFVLLLMAVILGTIVALAAGRTALALFDNGPLTVSGTLLLLTSTQIGLLVVTGGLVIAPRALAGVRLVGRSGITRSLLIGLGVAIPAWIAAQLLAALAALVLERLGFSQDVGVLDTVLQRGDPTVILLAFLLVAPVAEEIFFRGVVYNAWERERGGSIRRLRLGAAVRGHPHQPLLPGADLRAGPDPGPRLSLDAKPGGHDGAARRLQRHLGGHRPPGAAGDPRPPHLIAKRLVMA